LPTNGVIATAFVPCTVRGEVRSVVSVLVGQHGQTHKKHTIVQPMIFALNLYPA